MRGITYPPTCVSFTSLPAFRRIIRTVILQIFKNVIVINLGQQLVFVFEPCCLAHMALHIV